MVGLKATHFISIEPTTLTFDGIYSDKIFLLQVPQTEIKSHLHSEVENHLDLVCTKLRSTEEELWNTKDHLDLACTKLKNTEEELQSTKEKFEETTKKHEERIHALENKPFIYTWKINGFREILEQARTGIIDNIESEPFYTGECGYKVILHLFPNGSSTGKNTHLSIYLRIMKGDFDSILKWPFAKQFTFSLIDQQENLYGRENITKTIPGNLEQQDCNSRPLGECNSRWGFTKFVAHDVLTKRAYILEDIIFIQAKFETVV